MNRLVVIVTLIASTATTACVRVRAHQREDLAKRGMTGDQDAGEQRFRAHERGAREGADGATGQPGGGCGCN